MTLHRIFNLLRRPRTMGTDIGGYGVESATAEPSALPHLNRMQVQAAIIMHLEWCALFNDCLGADPDTVPGPAPLPDAEHSGLGQWIAGLSQDCASRHPLLDELAQENRHVHQLGQQALELARNQRMDLASSLLNMAFERSRTRVLEILRLLQKP